MKPPRDLLRQLPTSVERLRDELSDDPAEYLIKAFPEVAAAEPVGDQPLAMAELPLPEAELNLERERVEVLRAGSRGLEKIAADGEDADLAADEAFALEAIIMLEGRPAIFIQDGHFFPAPGDWHALEEQRAAIETVCRSVGRVEVTGHPSYDWVGTGFLVAPDVIMTNRHVAEVFCETLNGRKWRFKMGMTSRVDYVEELNAVTSAEFALTEVVGIHRAFDMALLRVAQTSSGGGPSPAPLPVSATPPSTTQDHQVYAVGYPAWDGRRNDPQEMMRIFANVFNVKRLLPGEITHYLPQGVFMHDCSTLGGNSGSCVVDLETHRVLGLHFGGRYLEGNYAVALWQLTGDPLLQLAQVHFQ